MTKKYYELTPDERLASLNLKQETMTAFQENQTPQHAQIIENYISDFRVPMGMLHDIIVNGQHVSVPMAIEEPSVIAAANNGAKMINSVGGVKAMLPKRTAMIGQMMFVDMPITVLDDFVLSHQNELLAIAQRAKPTIYQRGGGLLSVTTRQVSPTEVSVDFIIDTQDAMGANIVNTILEAEISAFSKFETHLIGVILSNHALKQIVTVKVNMTFDSVGGHDVAKKIVALNHFAKNDPYRATTENKGLFNGIGAVVLATGNDWRAVEASGHAYASRDGQYRALASWTIQEDQLIGELSMPISVGTVGGAISAMPQAKNVLNIMKITSADELRTIILATGLAQNLAALKAIASGGIQRGHMRMQYRVLALQVGATMAEVPILVAKLNQLKQVDTTIASKLLSEIRK